LPLITQSVSKDYLDMYSGYDQQKVGLGVIEPNIYASPSYQKKKIKNLVIGGISEVRYSGFEHDPNPLILTMGYNPNYNVAVVLNLNYCPAVMKKAILKFVLDTNAARIKSNLPIMVDYQSLKRAVPDVQYIVRYYKIVGVNVLETIPLVEWPEVIKTRSKWNNHYQMIKEGRSR
jgi:hypothetical protein